MKKYLFLITLSAILLLLAACTTKTEEPTPPPDDGGVEPAPTTAVATEVPAVSEPVVLRYGLTDEPDCLHHPFMCTTIWVIGDLLWEGFTGFGPKCSIIPRLAESMVVSEDGLTWTINLQEGVVWTDGEPFTAQDVVAYWDWITSVDVGGWFPPTLKSTSWQALDDNTFELNLASPVGSWANYDSVWQWPLPPQIWSELDNDTMWALDPETIVTTGPFMLTEWEQGSHMVFDANPDYYLGKPSVDRVVIQFYANEDAMILALQAGEINVIPSDVSATFVDQLASDPNITVVEQEPGRQLFLQINSSDVGVKHPALDDPIVREAIDYSLDRQRIIDIVLLGKGILCPNGGINCGPLYEWHLDPSQGPTPYDPTYAAQILDEAGYIDTDGDGIRETPDGEALTFRLFFEVDDPNGEGASRFVSEDLASVGIGTDLTAMEFASLANQGYVARDFDLVIRKWSGDADPAVGDFEFSCWSSPPGTGLNFTGYCNPAYDELIQTHAAIMGLDNRLPVIYEAQALLAQDRPVLTLAGLTNIGAFRSDHFDIPTDGCTQLSQLLGWYPTTHAIPVN